ncbi:MAG: hypothetical protein IKS19_02545 [Clostridia bacterium]|nr:hypothetical protein [Clostridia bacterium]
MQQKDDAKRNTGRGMRGIVFNQRSRIVFFATLSFLFNMVYALYNGLLGILTLSPVYGTVCAYYTVLSVMRFICVRRERMGVTLEDEYSVMHTTGILLIVMTVILGGMFYVGAEPGVRNMHHPAVTLSVGVYTFYKTVLAAFNAVRIRRRSSPLLSTLRNISLADALVSALTLHYSIIASLGGDIRIARAVTATLVTVFIFGLGLHMITRAKKRT